MKGFDIPRELWVGICPHATSHDLTSLCLVSKWLHSFAQPRLYHSITLRSFNDVRMCLATLVDCAELIPAILQHESLISVAIYFPRATNLVSRDLSALYPVQYLPRLRSMQLELWRDYDVQERELPRFTRYIFKFITRHSQQLENAMIAHSSSLSITMPGKFLETIVIASPHLSLTSCTLSPVYLVPELLINIPNVHSVKLYGMLSDMGLMSDYPTIAEGLLPHLNSVSLSLDGLECMLHPSRRITQVWLDGAFFNYDDDLRLPTSDWAFVVDVIRILRSHSESAGMITDFAFGMAMSELSLLPEIANYLPRLERLTLGAWYTSFDVLDESYLLSLGHDFLSLFPQLHTFYINDFVGHDKRDLNPPFASDYSLQRGAVYKWTPYCPSLRIVAFTYRKFWRKEDEEWYANFEVT